MAIHELQTDRLLLRRWKHSDRATFAAMNADSAVMEFFPSPLSTHESDAFVDRIESHFVDHGFGLWAVELVDGSEFAGFVGLWPATFAAHFTPAVEIGWRIGQPFWGRGLASEAARRVLDDGFHRLGLIEIVSFTAAINVRSRRVMERIGMTYDERDDFDHPSVAIDSPLRRHVLYRSHPAPTSHAPT